MAPATDTNAPLLIVELLRREKTGIVIGLNGAMVAQTSRGLAERVMNLWHQAGRGPLTLDFERVNKIDSLGIASLCDIHSQLSDERSCLRITRTTARVREVLAFMSIDTFIDVE